MLGQLALQLVNLSFVIGHLSFVLCPLSVEVTWGNFGFFGGANYIL